MTWIAWLGVFCIATAPFLLVLVYVLASADEILPSGMFGDPTFEDKDKP